VNYSTLPSMEEIKLEAKELRTNDPSIKNHAASLEVLSAKYNYKNWNTLRSAIEKEKYYMRPKSDEWYDCHARMEFNEVSFTNLFFLDLPALVLFNAKYRAHRRLEKVVGLAILFSEDKEGPEYFFYYRDYLPDKKKLDIGGTIDEILGFIPMYLFSPPSKYNPESSNKQERYLAFKEEILRESRSSLFALLVDNSTSEESPGVDADVLSVAEVVDVMHSLDDEFYRLADHETLPYEIRFQEDTAQIPAGTFAIFSDEGVKFMVKELTKIIGEPSKGIFETYGRIIYLNEEAREKSSFFSLYMKNLKELS